MILILYISSVILKSIFIVLYVETGYLYFYLTTGFEIVLAVFFIIYNVRNSQVIKKLTSNR